MEREDHMAVCRAIEAINSRVADVAADAAVAAVREGRTVKDVARALGVKPHVLRGVRQEAGVA
jgi:hypothetical protein